MLRYMVLSDSHRAGGWLARRRRCTRRAASTALSIVGDVHADARRFAELAGTRPLCVRGNCDSPLCPAPAERVEALGGARILLAHGDRYGVKSSLTRLSYRAEELACQAAYLRPHATRAFCGYVGGALLLNPGALREGNWAEVTVQEGKIVPRPALSVSGGLPCED